MKKHIEFKGLSHPHKFLTLTHICGLSGPNLMQGHECMSEGIWENELCGLSDPIFVFIRFCCALHGSLFGMKISVILMLEVMWELFFARKRGSLSFLWRVHCYSLKDRQQSLRSTKLLSFLSAYSVLGVHSLNSH